MPTNYARVGHEWSHTTHNYVHINLAAPHIVHSTLCLESLEGWKGGRVEGWPFLCLSSSPLTHIHPPQPHACTLWLFSLSNGSEVKVSLRETKGGLFLAVSSSGPLLQKGRTSLANENSWTHLILHHMFVLFFNHCSGTNSPSLSLSLSLFSGVVFTVGTQLVWIQGPKKGNRGGIHSMVCALLVACC